ncbi:hypothetical protein IAI10_11120 [Clostridium sp. 19966]|uniref:hypothetical protein n=1 Tax=Clostridium sp. 19966 TaxID=2768166 RepID=UPI0028DE6D52|nr:hypothetical protein [Clostridium sp. 19966]MDT8717208.1 hypothetical protein [Clostridium sp. 19966]
MGTNVGYDGNNCICSLPTLVILILIILQFSKKGHGGGSGLVDNGITFIVALFYLSCRGCGTW